MHDKTHQARQVLLKEKLKQEHLRARSQSPPPDAREVVRVVLSPPSPQQPPQVQQVPHVQQVQHPHQVQQLQHPQQVQQQHYRTIVSHMAEWVQWTRRCIGADVVSKLGVSSAALAAVSADAIGRTSSDNSSGGPPGGGTSLFGHVKPPPPLPAFMTDETYISTVLAPEAKAYVDACWWYSLCHLEY